MIAGHMVPHRVDLAGNCMFLISVMKKSLLLEDVRHPRIRVWDVHLVQIYMFLVTVEQSLWKTSNNLHGWHSGCFGPICREFCMPLHKWLHLSSTRPLLCWECWLKSLEGDWITCHNIMSLCNIQRFSMSFIAKILVKHTVQHHEIIIMYAFQSQADKQMLALHLHYRSSMKKAVRPSTWCRCTLTRHT